jgi:UDP-N-acetylmuramoylalanine--D-glutamate ligase
VTDAQSIATVTVPDVAGRRVAVLGLGKSGHAAALALARSGAEVLVWDDNAARRDAVAAGSDSRGIAVADLAAADFATIPTLVMSPGIPHSFPAPHPVAARARAAGTELICDVELLLRAVSGARTVAITGTNGKSTTTALIGHLLDDGTRPVAAGGNLGTPAVSLGALGAGGVYVLELSSYQLELISPAAFDVAVLLNLSADHLDRHGGMAGYIDAKLNIFAGQRSAQTAIVGTDDAPSLDICRRLAAAGDRIVVPVSATEPHDGGVYIAQGWLTDARAGTPVRRFEMARATTLPGSHNGQNAAAAFAAASAIAALDGGSRTDDDRLAARIAGFPGLAHRLELIATVGGVRFVNDSKATNADAAARALASYETIYWIAGGRAKEGGIDSLTGYFDRIRHAWLIGEAADEFAVTLAGKVATTIAGTLDAAVAAAARQARADGIAGAVVLLSPACASFDQFTGFEQRGDAFRRIVQTLADRKGNGARAGAA